MMASRKIMVLTRSTLFAGLLMSMAAPTIPTASAMQSGAPVTSEERELLNFFQMDEPGPGASPRQVSLYVTQWFLKDLENDRFMSSLAEIAEANVVCGYNFVIPRITERWHVYRDRKVENELRSGPYINYLRSRLNEAELKKQVKRMMNAANRRFGIRAPYRTVENTDLLQACENEHGRLQGIYQAAP